MKYVAKRDVPDLLELMTVISSARCNLELCTRELADELTEDRDILGGATSATYKRLMNLHECFLTVIKVLETAQEMTDAVDSEVCLQQHLVTVKDALFTPKDERTGWQKRTLYCNHVVEKDSDTPQQSFERYKHEQETAHVPEVELW